jgi:hypothetical protein
MTAIELAKGNLQLKQDERFDKARQHAQAGVVIRDIGDAANMEEAAYLTSQQQILNAITSSITEEAAGSENEIITLLASTSMDGKYILMNTINVQDLLNMNDLRQEDKDYMERINPQFALLPLESAASLLPESAMEITTALAFDALIQCMVYQFASDTRGTPGGAGIAIDEMFTWINNGYSFDNAATAASMSDSSQLLPGIPGAVDGTPGVVDGIPGAVDGTPGVVDGIPGAVDGTPGVVDGIPGAVEPEVPDLGSDGLLKTTGDTIVTAVGVTMGIIASGVVIGAAVYMSYRLWRKCRENMAAYREAVASAYQFHEVTVRLKSIMDYMLQVLNLMKLTVDFENTYDALKDIYRVFDRIAACQSHKNTLKTIGNINSSSAHASVKTDAELTKELEQNVMDDHNISGTIDVTVNITKPNTDSNGINVVSVTEIAPAANAKLIARIREYFRRGIKSISTVIANLNTVIKARYTKFMMYRNRHAYKTAASKEIKKEMSEIKNGLNANKGIWERTKHWFANRAGNLAVTLRMTAFDEDKFVLDLTAAVSRLNTEFMLAFANFTLITSANSPATNSFTTSDGDIVKLNELRSYKCMLRRTVYSPLLGIRSLIYACALSPDTTWCAETLETSEKWKRAHVSHNYLQRQADLLKRGVKTLFGPNFDVSYERIITLFIRAVKDVVSNPSFNQMFKADITSNESSAINFSLLTQMYRRVMILLKKFDYKKKDYTDFAKIYVEIFAAIDSLQNSLYTCMDDNTLTSQLTKLHAELDALKTKMPNDKEQIRKKEEEIRAKMTEKIDHFDDEISYVGRLFAPITNARNISVTSHIDILGKIEKVIETSLRRPFGSDKALDHNVTIVKRMLNFPVGDNWSQVLKEIETRPDSYAIPNTSDLCQVDESFYAVYDTTVDKKQTAGATEQVDAQDIIKSQITSGDYVTARASINKLTDAIIESFESCLNYAGRSVILPIVIPKSESKQPTAETIMHITNLKTVNNIPDFLRIQGAITAIDKMPDNTTNSVEVVNAYKKRLNFLLDIYKLIFSVIQFCTNIEVLYDAAKNVHNVLVKQTQKTMEHWPKLLALIAASSVSIIYMIKTGVIVLDLGKDTEGVISDMQKNLTVIHNISNLQIANNRYQNPWVLSFFNVFSKALNYTHIQSRFECIIQNISIPGDTLVVPLNQQNYLSQIKGIKYNPPSIGENNERTEIRENAKKVESVNSSTGSKSASKSGSKRSKSKRSKSKRSKSTTNSRNLLNSNLTPPNLLLNLPLRNLPLPDLLSSFRAAPKTSLAASSPAAAAAIATPPTAVSPAAAAAAANIIATPPTAVSPAAAAASIAASSPEAANIIAAPPTAVSPAAAAASLPGIYQDYTGRDFLSAGGSRRARRHKYKRNCSCKHNRRSKTHHKRSRRNHKKCASRRRKQTLRK